VRQHTPSRAIDSGPRAPGGARNAEDRAIRNRRGGVSPLPACGRHWIADRTGGTLDGVTAPVPDLLLVGRRHIDLLRVSSALCR